MRDADLRNLHYLLSELIETEDEVDIQVKISAEVVKDYLDERLG